MNVSRYTQSPDHGGSPVPAPSKLISAAAILIQGDWNIEVGAWVLFDLMKKNPLSNMGDIVRRYGNSKPTAVVECMKCLDKKPKFWYWFVEDAAPCFQDLEHAPKG